MDPFEQGIQDAKDRKNSKDCPYTEENSKKDWEMGMLTQYLLEMTAKAAELMIENECLYKEINGLRAVNDCLDEEIDRFMTFYEGK